MSKSVELELSVVELLCSRILHDLVSPIGAVNNGVELITEMGADMAEDAMSLIADSASQAARRLTAFRISYAAGGRNASMKETRKAALDFFRGSKIELIWPESQFSDDMARPEGFPKVLMNLLLLAGEALPQGGRLTLAEDNGRVALLAEGASAQLREGVAPALEGKLPPAQLDPRTVHAHVCGRVAAHYDFQMSHEGQGQGRLLFRLS